MLELKTVKTMDLDFTANLIVHTDEEIEARASKVGFPTTSNVGFPTAYWPEQRR
jgi:hypothetical protein